MQLLILALAWIIYCAIHSFLISISFTDHMKQLLKSHYAYYRLFYVMVSFALLIPIFIISSRIPNTTFIHWHPPWTYLKYGTGIIAIGIFLWTFIFDYDILTFIGIRQIMNVRKNPVKRISTFHKSGLLGIIRHPMYFAVLLLIWSQTTFLADVVVNCVLTAYIFIGTRLEEKKLILEFGDVYIQYQQEVPMIIPFLKW